MGVACVLHYGSNIGKVEVYKTREKDKVRNTLNTLSENIIGNSKCVLESDACIRNILESFVRNDDKRVNTGRKLCNTLLSLSHSSLAFKSKRLCNDADCKNAHILCDFGNYGSSACTCTAAHAGSNKYHIRILEKCCDFISALLGCLLSDLWHRACALTSCKLFADLNLLRSL